MPQPDVRIRLSAEGVTEVVNAFKKIQAEADKAKKSSALAGEVKQQLQGLAAEFLPELAIGSAVAGFVEMTTKTIELAAGMEHLHAKTGISTEALSVYSLAAREAGTDQESFNKGLVKAARFFDEYDKGARNAKDAVTQLFGNEDALKGLPDDERLRKVVDALAKLEPGAKRTGLAIQFFGKAGAELLPVIDKLGSGGFDELAKKAEKLGLVIHGDLAEASERAEEALNDLKGRATGIALQFESGFIPAIADVADALVEATTQDGVNGFKVMGEYAGKILKGTVLAVGHLAFVITEIFGKTVNLITNTWALADDILHGRVKGSLDRFRENLLRDDDALESTIAAKNAAFEKALAGGGPKKDKSEKDKSRSNDLDEQRSHQKALLELQEARANNELKLLQARLSLREAKEKEDYEKGLISLQKYYADRRAIIVQETDKEISVLQKKISDLQKAPLNKGEDKATRQKAIEAAQTELELKKLDSASKLHALDGEQASAQIELGQKALEIESKLDKAQGDRFTAARVALAAELNMLDQILKKEGVGDAERGKRVGAARAGGNAQIDFDEAKEKADLALKDLGSKRQEIDDQVKSGLIFQIEGQDKIRAIEAERLPNLQRLADAMLAAARASGDDQKIQQAKDFAESVKQIGIASNEAGQRSAQLKATLQNTLQGSLVNLFTQGTTSVKGFANAMRSMASDAVGALQRLAAQMLATLVIKKLFGGASGGGFLKGLLGGFAGGGPVQKADGGMISGPGTGTSDSIPALLSNGEYVVKSSVVRQPGVMKFLNSLNAGGDVSVRRRTTRFASGGLAASSFSGSGLRGGGSAALHIGLEEGMIVKHLEHSPEFSRVLVKQVEGNKKKINNALGQGAR